MERIISLKRRTGSYLWILENTPMKDNPYSDDQLVVMIGEGGTRRETAIRILMEEELRSHRLAKHLKRLGARHEECEEIIDDAFVALITGIAKGRFQPGGSIWGYLYGAGKNLLWKSHRRQKVTVELNPATIRDQSEESVEVNLIRGERKEQLLGLFRQLSEKCRNILHFAFFMEYSNEEIAGLLGYKSKEVVGVKKSECLKKLAVIVKSSSFQF